MTRHSYRVSIPTTDGLTLAGIVDRPRDNDGVDVSADAIPVAVFSHCFTCSKDLKAITRISRELSQLGVIVLRFDMRGLGGSGGDFSQSNFTTNMADLRAAIAFADQTIGRVTALIGHSFGGVAAMTVAADAFDPDGADSRLASLGAVVALAAPSDTVHLARLLVRMNPTIQSDGRGEVTIGGRTWTITREMVDDFQSHAVTDRFGLIRCPVLIFHSTVDETVHFDNALRLMSLIRDADGHPSCSLVSLAGADHLLVDEPADASFVAQSTAAFLHRYVK